MVRDKQRGFTLLELLVVSVVLAVSLVLTQKTLSQVSMRSQRALSTLRAGAEFTVLNAHLQEKISQGDLKVFGFSKKDSSRSPLIEMLLPVPGRCADLKEKSACKEDIGVFFASFEQTFKAMGKALCLLDAESIVIEKAVETSAPLILRQSSIGTLWMSGNNIEPISFTYSAATDQFSGKYEDLFNANCKKSIIRTHLKDNEIIRLLRLPLMPIYAPSFFDSSSSPSEPVTLHDIYSRENFPLEIFPASIHMLGRFIEGTPNTSLLSLSKCEVQNGPLGIFQCGTEVKLSLSNLTSLRVEVDEVRKNLFIRAKFETEEKEVNVFLPQ